MFLVELGVKGQTKKGRKSSCASTGITEGEEDETGECLRLDLGAQATVKIAEQLTNWILASTNNTSQVCHVKSEYRNIDCSNLWEGLCNPVSCA